MLGGLLVGSWMDQKDRGKIRSFTLPREGRGAGRGVKDQSRLQEEISIKSKRSRGLCRQGERDRGYRMVPYPPHTYTHVCTQPGSYFRPTPPSATWS